ncbi:hypothetical protein ElyMa_001272800 [Elysia marginata]|uniref:Uncharacterized protein n=1 Tax=Elysia marginata TaxID=1093978 RepID=A0AAV4IDW4_9GAST|nr:hypothetical protein ElyMa_001272800 [Elysia marginata]
MDIIFLIFHPRRQSQDISQQASTQQQSKFNSNFRTLQHDCLLGAQILTFYKVQALPVASTNFTGGWAEESVDKLLSKGNYNMRHGWESNTGPSDQKSDVLTTEPCYSELQSSLNISNPLGTKFHMQWF